MAIDIPIKMPKPTKKDHALHNEEVFNFLSPNVNYADWVLITAFYSAIHFVDHKIFPITLATTAGEKFRIKCINEYRNNANSTIDKHTHRLNLVNAKCPTIRNSFKWLKDLGSKSRYVSYTFDKPQEIIDQAKTRLSEIKSFCEV